MEPEQNRALAPFTSLQVGGDAARLYRPDVRDEVIDLLMATGPTEPVYMLGFGANSLISDSGLPGTTIMWRGGDIWADDTLVVADAGVWWDDLVQFTIEHELWGLELTSEIPGSVGAGIFGNIAAYGQQVSDTLVWVEVYDRRSGGTRRLGKNEIDFAYRESSLQTQPHFVLLQAAFELSRTPLHSLKYESALAVARELKADMSTLRGSRAAILETRKRAGSIWHPDDDTAQRTAGSFFKNPLVTLEQAKLVASYDETGKTLERINQQNAVHGGSTLRASAAHVLLAAGFSRGQTWGKVRLHPDHVLKIETLPGARARDVYDVAQTIITTVHKTLDITLTPEVRFLGNFSFND